MRYSVLVTMILLVVCVGLLHADGPQRVREFACTESGGSSAISSSNTLDVSASTVNTEAFRLAPSDSHSVALTITATAAFNGTITIEVETGTTASTTTWQSGETATTLSISDASGPYSKRWAFSTPVAAFIRFTFGADSGSPKIPYSVSMCRVARY